MPNPHDWFAAAGAAAWGSAAYRELLPFMDAAARQKAEALCPSPAGLYVAAFPYYAGAAPGNLSLYTRGEDYHRAVLRRLEGVCEKLRAALPGHNFHPGADSSPLPEKRAAALAGLGLQGDNTLIILPPFGSYVFLGTILTDLPLESSPRPAPPCLRCGRCAAVCPGGALEDGGLDPEKCLAHITQKKGILPPEQAALVAGHRCVWGCDLCQLVCPHNRGVRPTALPEFQKNLMPSLAAGDMEGLTNRAFQRAYGDKAFSWRGPGPLRRNFQLQADKA